MLCQSYNLTLFYCGTEFHRTHALSMLIRIRLCIIPYTCLKLFKGEKHFIEISNVDEVSLYWLSLICYENDPVLIKCVRLLMPKSADAFGWNAQATARMKGCKYFKLSQKSLPYR